MKDRLFYFNIRTFIFFFFFSCVVFISQAMAEQKATGTEKLAEAENFKIVENAEGIKGQDQSLHVPVQTQLQTPQGLSVQVGYAQENGRVLGIVILNIAPEYYAYAQGNPEDVGLPTRLEVYDARGFVQGAYFPAGGERQDIFQPDKRIFSYMGKMLAFADLGEKTVPKSQFSAELSLLLCSAKHCLPVNIPFTFTVPDSLPPLSPEMAKAWQSAQKLGNTNAGLSPKKLETTTLEQSNLAGTLYHDNNDKSANIKDDTANNNDATGKNGYVDSKQEQPQLENKWTTTLQSGKLAGKLTSFKETTSYENFSPRPFAPDLEVSGLGKALLFGLLAGLILNLMPCVLPVLTLKIQSLLLAEEGEERIKAFRTHNMYFAAGILTQFFLLALLLGTAGYMWGEFFQNVYFVSAMLVVIFVLALSLLGVFTLPMLDLKTSTTASPRRQAFMTGMVATLLATPCSGPLLGGVLSWAFLQPLHLVVLIIMFVGVGMSMPYILFSWQPQWVRFMPRPGAWMGFLEKTVAFFLLGTVIYMFSILPVYAHISMLVALLLLAFAGWLWGTLGGLSAPRWRRRLLSIVFMLGIVGTVAFVAAPPKASIVTWNNFNSTYFAENLGKKPLLVEFTADWCPNCKFVEKTVLTPENVQKWQEEYGLTLIKVDITRDNMAGEKLLHSLGSQSIPLTAIFGVGKEAAQPVVIRDIYSVEDLSMALEQALK